MPGKDGQDKKPKKIKIDIDGEEFSVEDREMTVLELLNLVDLNATDSYLIELHGKGSQHNFEDGDELIKLHNGQRFVSGDRAPAPVA